MTTDTQIKHKLSLLALARSTNDDTDDPDDTDFPEEEVSAINDDEQFEDEEDFIIGSSPDEPLPEEEGADDDNPLKEHANEYSDGNEE
jgi:hypothetical protein